MQEMDGLARWRNTLKSSLRSPRSGFFRRTHRVAELDHYVLEAKVLLEFANEKKPDLGSCMGRRWRQPLRAAPTVPGLYLHWPVGVIAAAEGQTFSGHMDFVRANVCRVSSAHRKAQLWKMPRSVHGDADVHDAEFAAH